MAPSTMDDPIADNEKHETHLENDKTIASIDQASASDEIKSPKEAALDPSTQPLPEENDPELLADIERFRRMDACLYKHRKEWETRSGPGTWNLTSATWPEDRRLQSHLVRVPGNHYWETANMNIVSERGYERPNIHDPTILKDVDGVRDAYQYGVGKDLYDTTIDWGNRRDRLRKTFEWEMDRLFLKEEVQVKRLEQQRNDEAKKRRERRMAESEANPLGESGDQPMDPGSQDPTAPVELSGIAWKDWPEFKNEVGADVKRLDTIDVLVGEPIIDDDVGGRRFWFRNSDRPMKKTEVPNSGNKSRSSPDPVTSPLPERIRINSDTLLRIIAGLLASEGRTLLEIEDMTAVFTRPYKVLSYLEEHLRGWCKVLERRLEGTHSRNRESMNTQHPQAHTQSQIESQDGVTKISGTDDPEPAEIANSNEQANGIANGDQAKESRNAEGIDDKESAMEDEDEKDEKDDIDDDADLPKSLTALKHLRCLLEFYDSSVAAKQSYFKSSQCRKVFFPDLWHLFQPGTEVIGSDGRQAYKVIEVNSAKHRVAPLWERWYRPTKINQYMIPDFSITCVYIDFDGTDIGPVQVTFHISRFDGPREVTSLEVYPLRFHPIKQSDFNEVDWKEMESYPVAERYRRRLIHRGASFLHVVRGKHMYYAGTTLDDKEEIESPVVIDFETAITTRDAQRKQHPVMPRGSPYGDPDQEIPQQDLPWRPKLSNLLIQAPEAPPLGDTECSGECCRYDFVYDDQYVGRKQRQEYIESFLPSKDALEEQPPISIMPRPLEDLKVGPGGSLWCSDDELVIMSYRVFGFVLRSRKFAKLDLTHLTDIHNSGDPVEASSTPVKGGGEKKSADPKGAFERLVLEDGHRDMVVSLIAQHFRDKKSATGKREEFDIVRGKGKGLIILLHGAPGVGKTSTAEGVAEKFRKPLFQITCGDLGTTASEVESTLEKNFTLANKWDCILLLDEADVFLTERSKEDFKRNGLVAVFLRLMEYYSGILFLTTNRVGDFDEAFTSRIHVSLYYPALNEEKTGQVFEINMDMIEERFKTKGRAIEIDRMKIAFFAMRYFNDHPDARWNGRQIRNACQTALALAEFEAQGNSLQETEDRNSVVKLNVKHFETVRNAYLEFAKYMQDLYGTSNSRRAKESKLRAVWIDENDNIVATQNKSGSRMDKTSFTLASRNLQGQTMGHPQQQQQQQQPPQQQPQPFQQPSDQQYVRFHQPVSTPMNQQPQYKTLNYQNSQQEPQYQAPQYANQQQGPPSGQDWQSQQPRNSGPFIPEPQQQEGQYRGSISNTLQMSPSPNRQQQGQPNPAWFNDNIRSMHAASGQQGNEQTATGANAPRGGNW